MTQPGEIDGVMKQMTQSFNPVIQETMRNPTVLKWLVEIHTIFFSRNVNFEKIIISLLGWLSSRGIIDVKVTDNDKANHFRTVGLRIVS